MEFEQRAQVTLDEYRAMADGKTGALIGAACALGADLAGAPHATVRALDSFGRCAGIAFQCIDDILGLWGDPQRTGKPVGADVACGKKTYPLLAALSAQGKAARRAGDLYGGPGAWSSERITELVRAVEEAGGRTAAEREATAQTQQALHSLNQSQLPMPAQAELTALADAMIHRRT
jgi:geranylgeranyl diphosphate synthase type I